MKKLLILDSNSIINRAFYGIRPLTAKDGTPTNAVYGFLKILFKLVDEIKPDYMCAAFDLKAPTFRHKMFDGYKAQRKPMPDDLRPQLPISKDILRAMDITILEQEGYEADDIIGTVSRMCESEDVECFIATGDKDDLQLATDKTKVILTISRSGVSETVIYDDKTVFEKYGVTPTEFIDVKALMGDPSDNIPGVAGVGEKTALSLISKYSNIEYIYDNIDDVGLKGAMLQKMKDGRDMAFLSKTLATIDTAVPISLEVEACAVDSTNLAHSANDELYTILSELSLTSIIKTLSLTPPSNVQEAPECSIFDEISITIVHDVVSLDKFIKNTNTQTQIGCLFKFNDTTLSYAAFSLNSGKDIYCIDTSYPLSASDVTDAISPILENEKIEKVTYNIKETLVKMPGIKFSNITYDVAIAVYLLSPERSNYDIWEVAEEYLAVTLKSDKDLGESGSAQLTLFEEDTDSENATEYARRVAVILPLMETTKSKIEAHGQWELYNDVELPLVQVLANMQRYGFKIDKVQLSEFSKMLSSRIDAITKSVYEMAGEEFNLNSPKQLGVILFERLGLKAVKKTKTGYSTNVDVLEKLRTEHPIIELLMEYRHISKLKSTYCDGLAAVINPQTGKIHSAFNQTVTVTGRISSTEPNMQNIPTRTELGREIRKMFIASSEDNVLVDADYSQIELRVLAHIANDDTMKNAFLSNEDIHAVTASQVLGIPLVDVTADERRSAKAVNFGIVYGIGEFSLAQDLKISIGEAKQYIKSYLEKYHGVREYMTSIKEQAKEHGYVKTLLNRIRYIPELASSNHNVRAFGERVALNTPIQGTAADIIKLAMVRVHNRLKAENLNAKLILQVHDELIVDTPKDEVDAVKDILRTEMEQALIISVPLAVDMSVGYSWYEAK